MAGDGTVRYFRRNREMRQLTLFSLMLAVIASPVVGQAKEAAARASDRIDRTSGGSIANVAVVKEDFNQVTYRQKGKSMTIPSVQVVSISRSATPDALREGRSKLLAGNLGGAVAPLQLAARNTTAWVKEYASFFLGEAFRGLGRAQDAVTAYDAVLQAKPDSRFLPDVRLGTAKAWTASKQYGKAEAVLKAFSREVDTKRLNRQHALSAKRLLGHNLEAQGKYSEARREYDSVITEARSLAGRAGDAAQKRRFEVVGLEAQRDKGSAFVKDKKYSDAANLFSKIASTRDDPMAQAIGTMGLGEVSLAQGQEDRARVQLSRVSALGFAAPAARPGVLYMLAQTHVALAAKGQRGASALAKLYIAELTKNYPGTPEARKAQDLQQKLK